MPDPFGTIDSRSMAARTLPGGVEAAVVVTCLVLFSLAGSSARAAIVECRDSRGVQILSPAGEGSACDGRQSSLHATSSGGPRAALTSPATFPRVSPETQRSRDTDRQRILQDELDAETARLRVLEHATKLPRAATASDGSASALLPSTAEVEAQLARSRQNVLAIQRELSGVR